MNKLFEDIKQKKERIGVVGLGYVGLPLALEFASQYKVVGFDISTEKVNELSQGHDRTRELSKSDFNNKDILFTAKPEDLKTCRILIVTVPTPIDESKQPDLTPLKAATKTVGKILAPKSIVIYESTVFPGVTEDVCVPILEKESGLTFGKDFKVGYSPERISPGDKNHTLTKITKIISASDSESKDVVSKLYKSIIKAGIFEAESIKVAEAAKVIENTQRDLNVALMNELAIIFNKMGINTLNVIEAAATKWNFMKMVPGLVGGHCIDVDPYYLTYKAEQLGYHPQVILAGRRINNGMGKYIAEQTVKQLIKADIPVNKAKIALLGITFKENVSDIRNSKVVDIVKELHEYGVVTQITDPHAYTEETEREYGITLTPFDELESSDALIIAVPHNEYKTMPLQALKDKIKGKAKIIIDVKGLLRDIPEIKKEFQYWVL